MFQVEGIQRGSPGQRHCSDQTVRNAHSRHQTVASKDLVGVGKLGGIRPYNVKRGEELSNLPKFSMIAAADEKLHCYHSWNGESFPRQTVEPVLRVNRSTQTFD